jgi:predicted Zn-dependent protease
MTSGGGAGTFSADKVSEARRQKKLDDDAKKRAQALAKIEKDRLKVAKEQTALQKAGTLFDQQQTSIIAALKGKITDEERTRLELQLAILTGNTSEASKLAAELAKSQGLSQQLVSYLASLPDAKNPFTAWKSYLDDIEAQARRIASIRPGAPVASGVPYYNSAAIDTITSSYGVAPASAGVSSSGDVYISVQGSVVSENDLIDLVNNGLLNRSLSGSPSAIGRLLGAFGR